MLNGAVLIQVFLLDTFRSIVSVKVQIANRKKEVFSMKGYYTAFGYMGYVDGEYMLFDCESDYADYLQEAA